VSTNPLELLHEFIQWCHTKKQDVTEVLNLTREQYLRTNEPQWDDNVPSDVSTQPYVVNYKNRRHIFIYNPSATAITLQDGTGEWVIKLPANDWANVSIPNSTQLKASTGPAVIKVKCTDEVVP
jgi:hypothetical protein